MPAIRRTHHVSRSGEQKIDMKTALHEICNRDFNVVTIINFFIMITYYLIFITSTSYARQVFSLDLSTAGLTAGIMVIGCLAARFVTGNLLSFTGCRVILFLGLMLYLSSISCFFLVDSVSGLFFQRFFSGVGVGVIGTATGTIIAYVINQKYHGLGISIFSMSTALALALGPFFGMFLMNHMPYDVLIWINICIVLGCSVIFFFLGKIPNMPRRRRPLLDINSYIDPRVVRFSLVALMLCFSYGCVQAFMTSYAMERHLTGAASVFFLVYAAAVLATRPLSGYVYDTRGENVIFAPIFLLTIASLVLLAGAESSSALLLSGVLLGIGFGNFQTVGQAVSLTLVTRSRFAQATTTFFMFFDLGIGLGPYLFGLAIPHVGYYGMYILLASTVFLASIMYYFLHGRHVR